MDNWIRHTNFHWTLSSQWVGVSAHHFLFHLITGRISIKMKAIILRIAGCTDRKHPNCTSELTNPGTAFSLDFLLHEIINSLTCSVYFWFCILLLTVHLKLKKQCYMSNISQAGKNEYRNLYV